MMPKNLVLVRHGESEGNVANKRFPRGRQFRLHGRIPEAP